jgi:3-phenylpropionate/trans-cinnamate dioxygenase ferredoxin component
MPGVPETGNYVRICRLEDVSEGVPAPFSVAGAEDPNRVLVRIGPDLFALSGVCPHEQGDLGEGVVDNDILWCPVHSSGFDCRTGAVVHPPAATPLRTYDVRIEGGEVYVRLHGGGTGG